MRISFVLVEYVFKCFAALSYGVNICILEILVCLPVYTGVGMNFPSVHLLARPTDAEVKRAGHRYFTRLMFLSIFLVSQSDWKLALFRQYRIRGRRSRLKVNLFKT